MICPTGSMAAMTPATASEDPCCTANGAMIGSIAPTPTLKMNAGMSAPSTTVWNGNSGLLEAGPPVRFSECR